MNLEDIAKDIQDGWIYQGRTAGNKFVLVGPVFLQPDVLCFQVRVERNVVAEGTARDAALAFNNNVRGEPTKLARVLVHKEDN